jgi:hypothetical protein
MFEAKFSNVLDPDWLDLEPIRVGRVPPSLPTPDRFVTFTDDGRPLLRVDLYSHYPGCFAFEDAIVWRRLAIIGFGSHVHVISIDDRSVVTVELGSYFGHLYPHRDFVLVASGEHLFRLQPDRSVLWKSPTLGIDGVVVREIGSVDILGEGEWDPPGGWRPFKVSITEGKPTQ